MSTRRAAARVAPLLRVVAALLAFVALLVVTVLGCRVTDRLLLHPTTEAFPDTQGAVRVTFPSKEGDVEVWRARSARAHAGEPGVYVLRFYGNADRADRWAGAEARGLPFAAELWGVNYPGFGGSGGSASLRGVAESALVAFDAMKKRAGNKPILVFGTSMGTTAALYLAAHREVEGLVLHNPPPLRQLIRGRYGWWNLWLLAVPVAWGVPSELDSIDNAAHARAPAIFVLSQEDEIVPHDYQLAIRDAYAGPKTTFVMPGARHNDPIPDETQRAIDKALEAIVAGRSH
ncbi:MAG: alpha/beta fold hydrolase [Deltaproteobacteria bacterium]|nr:alpha/beta fold hydrolase [Deltaproteobacteria bacterium]